MALWFVMCDKTRAPKLSALAEAMPKPKDAEVEVDDDRLVVTLKGCEVRIDMETGDDVERACRKISDEEGAGRNDRAKISMCTARFLIEYEASEAPTVYNILMHAASTIEELSGGVTWDVDNSRWV